MKNQVIKKIMAYLLAGAMIVTTPMVAFADEIADAFSAGEDLDFGQSNSSTNTNSDTNTTPVDIPKEIEKFDLNITGIVLDKGSLDFDEGKADKSISGVLNARVLFDDYDPKGEKMEWASIEEKDKVAIEKKIIWYSSNPEVASVVWDGDDPKKATVYAVGAGKAEVTAWIEADSAAYPNPYRPTPGDYQVTAFVSVSEKVKGVAVEPADTAKFYQKHTYDLRDYTVLTMTDDKKKLANETNVELVYSLASANKNVKLSADGILVATKAKKDDEVKINVSVPNSGINGMGTIKFSNAIEATHVVANPTSVSLDFADSDSQDVSVELQVKKGKTVTQSVQSEADRTDGNITDVVTWTSKDPKIADVSVSESDLKATITAKGVGSTTVVAKASGGRTANIKVTVTATPSGVKIVGINDIKGTDGGSYTYTGKPTQLKAVLVAEKNGKTIEIPAGTTKFTWTVDKINKKSFASVSGKDVATVKPTNYVEEDTTVTVNVRARGGKGDKSYDRKDTYKLAIKQSNISNITIDKKRVVTTGTESKLDFEAIVSKDVKSGKDDAYIGTSSVYQAVPVDEAEKDFKDSIGWTISGTAATLGVDEDGNTVLVPVKAGKATLTASYVTVNSAKKKGMLNKKTVSVTVVQNATSIAFAKAETVKNPSTKDQTVSLKVNVVEPKKATLNVAGWKANVYIKDADGKVTELVGENGENIATGKTGTYITKATKNSVNIKIPKNTQAGSVIKVGAYTDGGVTAYAYIYVTEKTAGVEVNGNMTVNLGETKPIGDVKVKVGAETKAAALVNDAFGTKGGTTAYITEPVTYSVDKASAMYIRVSQNGKVTGLQKTPGNKTATVTVKTVSGKSAKVRIKVN